MWAGCYETHLIALLKRALGPGMVFVDVGAHIGYFTSLGAGLVGPQGEVHCFEADPDCTSRLVVNTRNYSWVHVHNAAVGDRIEEVSSFRSNRPDESGWGTVLPTGESRPEIRVPMTTLDESRSRSGFSRLDFIKLDIEGAECRALQGASQMIGRHRPFVFSEVNEVCLARDCRSLRDLTSFFAEKGYEVRIVRDTKGSVESLFAIPAEKSALFARY